MKAAMKHDNIAKVTVQDQAVFKRCDTVASTYGAVTSLAQDLLDGKVQPRQIGLWIAKQGENDPRAKSVYQQIQNAVVRLSKEKLSFGKARVKDGEFGGFEYAIRDKAGRGTKGKGKGAATADKAEGGIPSNKVVTPKAILDWAHNYLKDRAKTSEAAEFRDGMLAIFRSLKLMD